MTDEKGDPAGSPFIVGESTPYVVAVARDREHRFSKTGTDAVALVVGRGIAGDAHYGARVQHRSRVAVDPSQPNLRQVHLAYGELLDEMVDYGLAIGPGALGGERDDAGH